MTLAHRGPAPCSVTLAWWPQDTALVAGLAAVANEVRSADPPAARTEVRS